jgi:DNA relaxase NicK
MPLNTAWSIDWLSLTFKNGETDLEIRKACAFGMPLKTWSEMQARFGYAAAFSHPFGHYVMTNPGRPEMGVHLAFTGRALHTLSEGGVPATQMLKWALDHNAKPTRLDLAIDVFDVEIDPIELAACPRIKNAPGSARKWSSLQGDRGGKTAYIGSRKSERFLRIYDKAAESGDHSRPWTRFELEFKGQAARAAALQMSLLSDEERPLYIQGLIKALFNPDDAIFQAAMTADAIALKTVKDTDDKTLTWLLNSVSKTMAKTMKARGDTDVWGEFVRQVHANLIALGVDFPSE